MSTPPNKPTKRRTFSAPPNDALSVHLTTKLGSFFSRLFNHALSCCSCKLVDDDAAEGDVRAAASRSWLSDGRARWEGELDADESFLLMLLSKRVVRV
jgi:hypothetical protein